MKKTNIIYWVLTSLFAGFMIFSAIPNIMSTPESIELISTQLGYPQYVIPFIGVAKLLGAVAILVPGLKRIKEWAYAGVMFDLVGATYSFIAIGLPVQDWSAMLIFVLMGAASYFFYHKRSKQLGYSSAQPVIG